MNIAMVAPAVMVVVILAIFTYIGWKIYKADKDGF